MKSQSRVFLLFILFAGVIFMAACGSVVQDPYFIEIDFPPDYTLVYVNDPVAITAHANAPVSGMTFYVNDAPFAEMDVNPVAGSSESLWEGRYTWTPFLPGDYILRVWAHAISGDHLWSSEFEDHTSYSARKSIHIRVAEPPPSSGGGSPTPTAMALSRLDFNADSLAVFLGECTVLRWDSLNVVSLTLDGNPVNLFGNQEVCPTEPSVYVLRGETLSGTLEKQVSINVIPPTEKAPSTAAPPTVQAPTAVILTIEPPTPVPPTPVPPTPVPDTTGPALSNFTAQPAVIYDNPNCGTTTATVNVTATDPSKVSAVTLYFRAVRGGVQGKWVSKSMTEIGKSEYQATLTQAEINESLVSFTDGTIEFYVTAVDGKGNSSTSGVISIQIKVCIL